MKDGNQICKKDIKIASQKLFLHHLMQNLFTSLEKNFNNYIKAISYPGFYFFVNVV